MAHTAPTAAPYIYLAVDTSGSRRFGMRAAESETILADSLGADRLLLVRSWRMPKWAARSSGMSLNDQADLNEQLAQLVDRGVPLVEALEVAASVVSPDGQIRLRTMREQVAAGASFAEACEKAEGFDEVAIAVYRAAERTGELGEAARRLAESASRRQAIKSKAITLLMYPMVLLVVATVVTLVILMFVVPRIGAMLISAEVDLPILTVVVLAVGDALRANWFVLLLVVSALAIGGIAMRDKLARAGLDLLRRLPAVRQMILTADSARFFSVMAAMTRSGVTLADSLGVAAQAVGDPSLRKQLEDLQRGLMEGGVWGKLVEEVGALTMAVRKLLIAGERAGDMDSVLAGIAEDLGKEVDTRAERLLALLEPGIIVLMFGLIGTIVLSLMLPMLNLSSAIQ